MRIIAGRARRLPLKAPSGKDTRPTTDRIKETLFNMISYDVADATFLDLFSGSGNIGLEAASRGAKEVILVENNRKACEVIEENIQFTHLGDVTSCIKKDVFVAMGELANKKSFDIIFADPPYHLGLERQILHAVKANGLLKEEGYLIIEADLDTDFSFANEEGFHILKEKLYKTNKHVYLEERE